MTLVSKGHGGTKMARLTPMLLGLTFVIAVAALVLALWPVVADAPWEDGVTEPELREIIQTEHEASSKASKEEKEAERVAKCDSISELMALGKDGSYPDAVLSQVLAVVLENDCILDWKSP